ncbi:tetratricopeptide repeat protein [uncultured Hymenobacter sp.]|uniref:tetratricopeptide repeat protein n=1 Tax=uncultured Hymenobacter sp. TaxID=170016 RepID=UPI0035CA5EED
MSFKPWKKPLLAALALAAGTSTAIAQNVPAAQKAIELERYNQARALLRSDSSPEGYYEMGRLYELRDMPDSAAFYFNRAAGSSPVGQVAAGRALLAKGQKSAAEAQFDAAMKSTKNKDTRILTLIQQAYGESDVKDISKAVGYYTAAQGASKSPLTDPALLVARGDVYLHSDTGGGEAMSSYDRATAVNSNYTRAFFRKGVLSVRARNFNAARENLEKAIQIEPTYAPAYRELADMYFYAGKYDLALTNIKKFSELAEPSTRTDAQYASFLYLTKKYPEALEAISKALAKEPGNLTMNRLKAYTLYETGDYAGATTAMDAYLKLVPADKVLPEDKVYQGKILIKAGRADEGIALIEKAVSGTTDPAKACDLRNDLASAYIAKKDYKKAISTIKGKFANAACNADLTDQFRLASAYSSAKQHPAADSVFNIIQVARPTYGPGYLARASNIANLDPDAKKGLAKPHYEKYVELSKAEGADPAKFKAGLVEAYGYLGVYNFQKGDKATALTNFEQVLALDPDNKGAANNIKILKAPARAAPSKASAKKN